MSFAVVTSRHNPTYHDRAGTLLIGLLALFSLVYDACVLQTHRHPPQHSSTYGSPQDPVVALEADDPCELCAAAAAQEPFLPSHQIRLIQPSTLPPPAPITRRTYHLPGSRAHSWRSRAPPGPVSLL